MLLGYLSVFVVVAQVVLAQNILLTNDDSWAATNIRAVYRELTNAGHRVVLVAPVSQRSGFGGKFDVPSGNKLETNGEFSYVNAGQPAWGHELDDPNVWYFNGTPASCVSFALKYVLPTYFDNMTVDLVVSGPNEGNNLGQFAFSALGTMGATYNAVYRGIPAVAFSGAGTNNSFFKDSLDEDPLNPANIYAKKITEFVAQIFTAQGSNANALPVTTGMNVNFPRVGYDMESCTDPKWVFTRITGELSATYDVVYNLTSNTFGLLYPKPNFYEATTVCDNGDCTLPSENMVLTQECLSAVSVFSIDYDAKLDLTNEVKTFIEPLFVV